MESFTTIRNMLAGNKVVVPAYQRAYSWETALSYSEREGQVNTFVRDLEDFSKSGAESYYFGHFLFSDKGGGVYEVVDGQQRLTTIVIFLSALFSRLKEVLALEKNGLEENEMECYEDMVKRNSTYRFSTVDYDNVFFREYVIDQSRMDTVGCDTASKYRIVKAFDYLRTYFDNKDTAYCARMLEIVSEASCSTHCVKRESDAVQMFIFQNNRGKKPSNLEIIKARFMYNIHLYGKEETENLLRNVKEKFEEIYKSISYIENNVDEDDVLLYTLRVYFNSLQEWNTTDKIDRELSGEDSIRFIKDFTNLLSWNFAYLKRFFKEDESCFEIHSLITLGSTATVMPFILKSYQFGISLEDIRVLCRSFESIMLRNALIGTRADITSRLNDVFKAFTKENASVRPIIERIERMRTTDSWWWAYWNNTQLEYSIQGRIEPRRAKYILWKYENYLKSQGKAGYSPMRFDAIESPELEHIAPQTQPDGTPEETGYPEYDEEFRNQYVDCLGNYLLVSKSHNCAEGNRPFAEKRASYTQLAQQREVVDMTEDSPIWDKEKIAHRKEKLVDFVLRNF